MHFERDFEDVYLKAVSAYQSIAQTTQTTLHSANDHLNVLASYQKEGRFSVEGFRHSLEHSLQAAMREIETVHLNEYITSGDKGYFFIRNQLGGIYHLTADSVTLSPDGQLRIQESKNTVHDKFPKESDIADGLFKLILFTNLDELKWNDQSIPYTVCLELTGNLIGELQLPTTADALERFIVENALLKSKQSLLARLNDEAQLNPKLTIYIKGNNV